LTHEHAPPDFARLNGWNRPYEVYVPPEIPAYTGVTLTFCNRPLVEDPAELARREPDVVIVGAPFDEAVSYRPGARFGPRAIRQATYTQGGHSLQVGIEPFEERAIRRIVARVPLAGMDIVEVSPPYDHAEVTAAAAHRCALEAISALALRKRDGKPVRFATADVELPPVGPSVHAAGAGG
jgi:arginase family enzyme